MTTTITVQTSDHAACAVLVEELRVENAVHRRLDDIAGARQHDPRWLAIGRTHIQEAFMAINRAIFKPQRVELPGDAVAGTAYGMAGAIGTMSSKGA